MRARHLRDCNDAAARLGLGRWLASALEPHRLTGFVMELHERPQNLEIVRAIVNLGQSVGRKVVAAGIETAQQLAQLRSLGVDFGQGYLPSRPLTALQVDELLNVTDVCEPAAA